MIKKNIRLSNPAADGHPNLQEALEVLDTFFEWKYESTIEEVAAEMEEGDRVVLIMCPDEPMLFTSYENRNESYEGFEFDYGELEDEYGLCMVYDSDCVVTLGEHDYLVEAPLMVTNIDHNGNECSITVKEAQLAVRFLTERETVIEVDGEVFPAIRLND